MKLTTEQLKLLKDEEIKWAAWEAHFKTCRQCWEARAAHAVLSRGCLQGRVAFTSWHSASDAWQCSRSWSEQTE